MLVVCLLLWWVLGMGGFYYWWTSQYDLTSRELSLMILVGLLMGPFSWVFGYTIHTPNKTIFTKRN